MSIGEGDASASDSPAGSLAECPEGLLKVRRCLFEKIETRLPALVLLFLYDLHHGTRGDVVVQFRKRFSEVITGLCGYQWSEIRNRHDCTQHTEPAGGSAAVENVGHSKTKMPRARAANQWTVSWF